MNIWKTIKLVDLEKEKKCIALYQDTFSEAAKSIMASSEEHILDMVCFFLPSSFKKEQSIEDETKLSVDEARQLCKGFIISNNFSDIVDMLIYGFGFKTVDVIVRTRNGRDCRVQIKSPAIRKRKPMSNDKLRTIAQDLHAGRIFCDRQIKGDDSLYGCVFMPLFFMDPKDKWRMSKNPPGLVYEYLTEAGGRAINGYPTFMSMRMLTQEDTKRMFVFYDEFCDMVDKFHEKEEKPT